MTVVYADTIFLTNLIVNYLVLIASAKICAATVSRLRIALGAALGGVYAVFAALPPFAVLKSPIIIAAVGVLVVIAAFGGEARIVRLCVVFFAASAAFAGAALAVTLLGGGDVSGGYFAPISFKALALSFAICYAVMTVVFRGSGGNRAAVKKVTVNLGGRELILHALVDTGNTLRDPISGGSIIITGVDEGKKLLPVKLRKTVSMLGTKDAVTVLEELAVAAEEVRFQLIPYSSVGIKGGMLIAFRADEVSFDGSKKQGVLIALSPNEVSDNGTYTALIGA